QSRYFSRDELPGQSQKTREIQPTSLFHTANQGVKQDEQHEYYVNDENAMQEEDHALSHHYREQDLPEQDVSPVKTVIVTNKKRKRHSSNSTGTSTLVMTSSDSHAQDSGIPSKTFNDIIGHGSVKLRLEEIILPLKLPSELSMSVFRGIRSLPASVLLMGTGKTMLAKAVAGEAKAAFLPIGPSDILSKYVGESEAAVKAIFAKAVGMAKQVESRVTVIFFDEIDALGQTRGSEDNSSGSGGLGSKMSTAGSDACSRRVLAELLIQLSRINCSDTNLEEEDVQGESVSPQKEEAHTEFHSPESKNDEGDDIPEREHHEQTNEHGRYHEEDNTSVTSSHGDASSLEEQKQVRLIILAATNRPKDCDPALLRRFGILVDVPLPRLKDRIALLKCHLKDVEHTIAEDEFARLAKATEGWSGSELESLARDAVMTPVRECIREAATVGRRYAKETANDANGEKIGQVRAQIFLEEEIAHLRPVGYCDYVNAIKFWSNRLKLDSSKDATSPLAKLGIRQRSQEGNDGSFEEEN
ncbi:MAG: hypothetical protein SGILL_007313, partial [Bacillariaceae sp.]